MREQAKNATVRFSYMLFAATALIAFLASFTINEVAAQLTHRIAIIGPYVGLELVKNPGIAYGIRIPSPWQEILICCALGLVVFAALREKKSRLIAVAFGLIVGGASANMLDRLLDGVVTDYIQVGTFYVFNVPDSIITIGAGLLLLQAVLEKRKR